MFTAKDFFSTLPNEGPFASGFSMNVAPWQWIASIHSILTQWFATIPTNQRIFSPVPPQLFVQGDVFIAPNVKLPPYGFIQGPTYIASECELRPGVYIRGNVIVGRQCVLGNSCEFKNALLMEHVQVPHFNYVGDSILGNYSHLGAGAILSNVRLDRKEVHVKISQQERIPTGLLKMGAILGDHAEVGCNSVLNPGTCLFPNVKIAPGKAITGCVKIL